MNDEKEFLTSLIKGIAAQVGEKCEVVLHDLTRSYDSSIIAIENNQVTGRTIGDSGTNLGLEVLRGSVQNGDRYNYITQTKDGKILRSTSIYIRNEEGKTIGAICINLDISDFIMAEKTLKSITQHNFEARAPEVEEVFVKDVNELLDYLLQECQKEIGKPVSHMSKEEKMQAIRFLDQRGAFLIKKAGDRVCQLFDISKYTLYNYLDEGRGTASK
ncbi:helix-turn-helix transcriptional regulator [Paenibacillus humicola]|uniref:helix-turn-helix transcriptional regulator n=1 Tax=Paenibacillus humicola TaxID=3110540 RepID=UPI00308415DC